MKTKKLLLVITFMITGLILNAQSFPDPEFSSRPYILEDGKTLKSLERADAQLEWKIKGMGYGGSESYFTTFTPNSDVRFTKGTLPKLIIKVDGDVDPSEVITLSKGVVKKKKRKFIQGSMSMTGKARNVSESYIKLEFKKIRKGIYEIILPNDLEPGEYAFMPISSGGSNSVTSLNSKVKISCFGID